MRWGSLVEVQRWGRLTLALWTACLKRGSFLRLAYSEHPITFSPRSQGRGCIAWKRQLSRVCASTVRPSVAEPLSKCKHKRHNGRYWIREDRPLSLICTHVARTVSNISQISMSPSRLPQLPHMQSSMTVNIRSSTTSSPEESLASNLQCEMAELTVARATSTDGSFFRKRPQVKKECRAERAADVMGPVDRGERMIERKGARISVRDIDEISISESRCYRSPLHRRHCTYLAYF